MKRQTLISDSYLDSQKWLHAQPRGYGGGGAKWRDTVLDILAEEGEIQTILDYGCGQGKLVESLEAAGLEDLQQYDPALPPFDIVPRPADLVVCTDVLEHIEPEHLGDVIAHLHMLTRKAMFCTIGLAPANKRLPDGRNAHLTIQPVEWWIDRLRSHFIVATEYDHTHKTAILLMAPLNLDEAK